MRPARNIWSGGLADWTSGDDAFISVVFTWKLHEAYSRAIWYANAGLNVHVGGPALYIKRDYFGSLATVAPDFPDAISHHNPYATIASRGCPVDCWFCIVPKMEGKEFDLVPDFPVRPILCDSNLSALPVEYQDHIIDRYKVEGIPLMDACNGFEPAKFDEDTYHRWSQINRGPWRFGYDETKEEGDVVRMLGILKDEASKKKRVYVLIGNEPIGHCLARIMQVIHYGGEPHVQPFINLNAMEKTPSIRHDWTPQLLSAVARWANRRIWRSATFAEYRGSIKSSTENKQQVALL